MHFKQPNLFLFLFLPKRSPFSYDLGEKSRAYILKYFVDIAAKSEQILKIKIEDLFEIINDDMLNCKDEEIVWKLCLKWIDLEPEQRSQPECILKLLQGVRLGLLPTSVNINIQFSKFSQLPNLKNKCFWLFGYM